MKLLVVATLALFSRAGLCSAPRSEDAVVSAAPITSATAVPEATVRAVDVCVGGRHACALDSLGNVDCWGENDAHQIDASTVPQRESPQRIGALPPIEALACGGDETCARGRDGGIACWGASRPTPSKVAGIHHARDLAMSPQGGCAIIDDGRIACFASVTSEARVLDGIDGAEKLAVMALGASTFCVLRGAKVPLCFDVIFRDQAPKAKAGSAPPVPLGPAPRAASVSEHPELSGALDVAVTDYDRICVVFRGGPVRCAGGPLSPFEGLSLRSFSSASRQTGCGTTETGEAICGGLASANDLVLAREALDFGCGVTRAGAIACWGSASHGQLGDGTRYFRGEPQKVPGIDDAVSLAVGKGAACVARKSGKLNCWGRMLDNDLAEAPHDIATSEPVSEVVLGDPLDASRLCAKGQSGWKCKWGETWAVVPKTKEVLVGKPKPRLVSEKGRTWQWAPWSKAPEPDFFSQVGLRMKHVSQDGYCGVDLEGRLVCGHCGACSNPRAALSIVGARGFTEAASLVESAKGQTLACGIRDAAPVCFVVDDAPWTKVETPAESPLEGVGAFADVRHIVSSGGRYEPSSSCVLTERGEVGCWGDNRFLQRGPDAAPESTVTRVSGLPLVVEVGTAGSFVCARTDAGSAYCWGSNREGGAPDASLLVKPAGVRFRLP